MRYRALALALLLASPIASAAPPPGFQVGDTAYLLRWTGDGGLAEYTPEGQDDLNRYSEMISLAPTPAELAPAGMAGYARAMADFVREGRNGDVLSQDCVPEAADHAAECTMLVAYAGREATELAFTRLVAVGSTNVAALVLSHREYGDASPALAKAWLASPAGRRTVAGFLDWASQLGQHKREQPHDARATTP